MEENKSKHGDGQPESKNQNAESQAVDKRPGEGRGKEEKIRPVDLKGKKVDGDPSKEEDKPASQ